VSAERKRGQRQRQAQLTRTKVTAAARRLFAQQGYMTTTIEAIATRSRVPVQTIYSAFGAKPAILEEIRRQWILETEVAELHAAAMRVRDPSARLVRAAHWTRRQFELGHDVIAVHEEAARQDLRVARSWRAALTGREGAIVALIRPLSANLRPGLSVRGAVDVYVALTLPEIYRTLVIERSWSLRRYEAWLARALALELLGS
jgi:AcrR family transcriptional regulator